MPVRKPRMRFKCLGHTYQVRFLPEADMPSIPATPETEKAAAYGWTMLETKDVLISDAQCPTDTLATLFHEALHIATVELSVEMDHDDLDRVSQALAQIWAPYVKLPK